MMFKSLIFICTLAGFGLLPLVASSINSPEKISVDTRKLANDSLRVWIFFNDKGESIGRISKSVPALPQALARRSARGNNTDIAYLDRTVSEDYIAQIRPLVSKIIQQSRWLNAVSAYLRPENLDDLSRLDFVREIRSVAVYKRPIELPVVDNSRLDKPLVPYPPEYGPSWQQMNQIQVPELHDLGYRGAGIRILMLDTGFRVDHPVFAHTDIEATYDFINNDDDVQDDGELPAQQSHGTQTLSVIGANAPNLMLGVAYEATFLLAKTEIVQGEIQAEEDNWVAGIEWGEQHGCDVVSSSLGYTDWYRYADMDGNTAVTTKAADIAASLGVMVINSIGNDQRISLEPTLIAPSDGDSVLAIGAVNSSGQIALFSSNGPSADGRVKPDLCAWGVSNAVANPADDGLTFNSGTSFSCPLVAGVVALLLEAKPEWKYGDLFQALTSTSTRANSPDSVYGYGIVRALDALEYEIHQSRNISGVVAYPNPFSVTVNFDFEISPVGPVEIRIYTIAGEKVSTLTRAAGDPGPLVWNGLNLRGEEVADGVYLAYVSAAGISESKKIVKIGSRPVVY